jgi:hypothetical protein
LRTGMSASTSSAIAAARWAQSLYFPIVQGRARARYIPAVFARKFEIAAVPGQHSRPTVLSDPTARCMSV